MRSTPFLAAATLRGLLVAALFFPAAAAAQVPPELLGTIDARFRRYMEDARVPGLVYGIIRNGRTEHIGVLGVRELTDNRPVDSRTLFRIASMSKLFTALAILTLRDDGKLSLDALAETYVPELKDWRYPTDDAPRIRVRDLLSHVGGFVTDDPWGDRQQYLSEEDFTTMLRRGVPFTRPPGQAFEYSNFGYALLGRIVSNVSGRPYKEYIEQRIMRPLGMTESGYDIFASPPEQRALGYRWENEAFAREPDMAHGAFGAMGGVQTHAEDYAKWMSFLLSAWPARDDAEAGPARRATVRELAQGLNFPARGNRPGASNPPCIQAANYGMGLRVMADCEVGLALAHGGGYPGYGSYMLLLPDHGVGVFAFANRTYAGPTAAVWDVAMELHKAGWLTGRSVSVSAALAESYGVVGAIYAAGTLEPGRRHLAMNFLMDRSAENWAAELARLRSAVGACRTEVPVTATGALSGLFAWSCERGELQGSLLLAPTHRATIQSLSFRIVRRP